MVTHNNVDKNQLTLEKERVVERLTNVENQCFLINNKLDYLAERIDRHSKMDENFREDVIKSVVAINEAIIGKTDKPGIAEKVRELQKGHKHIIALWVAIGGFIANAIKDFFIGHIK